MQRLKVEDQIQLADVFEKAVEGFDEDLDQIEQGERGLRRGGDEDEVERCVVAVCDEGGGVVVGLGRARGGGGGRGQQGWEPRSAKASAMVPALAEGFPESKNHYGAGTNAREKVASRGRAVCNEGEDLGDQALLYAGVLGGPSAASKRSPRWG